MRQLALDLKLADYARFESYYAGPNQIIVDVLRQIAAEPAAQVIWLWGAGGSGRSHLLQSVVAAAAEHDQACAWLPLADVDTLVPDMLEGMGRLDLVCVDDVQSAAGRADWERALFRLYEALRDNHSRLVVAADAAPAGVAFALKDLGSRLASGPTWKLQPLQDDDRLAALQLRAHWRGLDLPDDTGRYLLRRVTRDNVALFALLDKLDVAALAAQRRLTIPFVKQTLNLDA